MSKKRTPDQTAFIALLKAVYLKCFGQPLDQLLSEPESRHLSLEVEEKTGLVIGWKSLKNYAAYVLDAGLLNRVNPSPGTLDTLARYVMEAPPTSEVLRKKAAPSFPYWFRYREQFSGGAATPLPSRNFPLKKWVGLSLPVLTLLLILAFWIFRPGPPLFVEEDFESLEEEQLWENGWELLSRVGNYWKKRDRNAGHLTLYTLKGDSWPTEDQPTHIPNLLIRKVPEGGFSAEVHFSRFIPLESWQQAGLILLEDTLYQGKSLRLSLAYNSYFGGMAMPGEIIVQAVASYGKNYQQVEEVVHYPLFSLDGITPPEMVSENLKYSALRIEKKGASLRLLYAASPFENFSFKELKDYTFDLQPNYVGIFALKGFTDSTSVMPVSIRFFRLDDLSGE